MTILFFLQVSAMTKIHEKKELCSMCTMCMSTHPRNTKRYLWQKSTHKLFINSTIKLWVLINWCVVDWSSPSAYFFFLAVRGQRKINSSLITETGFYLAKYVPGNLMMNFDVLHGTIKCMKYYLEGEKIQEEKYRLGRCKLFFKKEKTVRLQQPF